LINSIHNTCHGKGVMGYRIYPSVVFALGECCGLKYTIFQIIIPYRMNFTVEDLGEFPLGLRKNIFIRPGKLS